MDPLQKFRRCVRITQIVSKLLGRNIFQDKNSPTNIFKIIVIMFLIYIFGGAYTIKYYDLTTAFAAAPIIVGMWQV